MLSAPTFPPLTSLVSAMLVFKQRCPVTSIRRLIILAQIHTVPPPHKKTADAILERFLVLDGEGKKILDYVGGGRNVCLTGAVMYMSGDVCICLERNAYALKCVYMSGEVCICLCLVRGVYVRRGVHMSEKVFICLELCAYG